MGRLVTIIPHPLKIYFSELGEKKSYKIHKITTLYNISINTIIALDKKKIQHLTILLKNGFTLGRKKKLFQIMAHAIYRSYSDIPLFRRCKHHLSQITAL